MSTSFSLLVILIYKKFGLYNFLGYKVLGLHKDHIEPNVLSKNQKINKISSKAFFNS